MDHFLFRCPALGRTRRDIHNIKELDKGRWGDTSYYIVRRKRKDGALGELTGHQNLKMISATNLSIRFAGSYIQKRKI